MTTPLGLTTYLQMDFDSALKQVTDTLKAEGFGVITEMDMQAIFKNKLSIDFRPYKILGACNPTLAHRALSAIPEMGLLLPCNVTVSQIEDGRIEVAAIDPLVMMNMVDNEVVRSVAQEARDRLGRFIAALG